MKMSIQPGEDRLLIEVHLLWINIMVSLEVKSASFYRMKFNLRNRSIQACWAVVRKRNMDRKIIYTVTGWLEICKTCINRIPKLNILMKGLILMQSLTTKVKSEVVNHCFINRIRLREFNLNNLFQTTPQEFKLHQEEALLDKLL